MLRDAFGLLDHCDYPRDMKYLGTPYPIQSLVEQFHEMFTENIERPKTISIVVQTQKIESIAFEKG